MTVLSILVVEDEPLIAMMLEDFIETLGHNVAGTADCVAAAMPIVQDAAFDLAILDVNLRGGETCWPLADALSDAGKPFILASGGADGMPDAHKSAPMISKPYTMDGIRVAVESVAG